VASPDSKGGAQLLEGKVLRGTSMKLSQYFGNLIISLLSYYLFPVPWKIYILFIYFLAQVIKDPPPPPPPVPKEVNEYSV
jgi:hypothetical protein